MPAEQRFVVQEADDTFTITFSRVLHTSRNNAWNALVDSTIRKAGLPGVELPSQVGGTVFYDFGEEGTARGEATTIISGQKYTHTWVWDDSSASEVTWTFSSHDAHRTTVTVSHRGCAAEEVRDYAIGWHMMIDAFAAQLTTMPVPELDFDELSKQYTVP